MCPPPPFLGPGWDRGRRESIKEIKAISGKTNVHELVDIPSLLMEEICTYPCRVAFYMKALPTRKFYSNYSNYSDTYRLELKGNKYVLGEFLEFKGDNEDIRALGNIRRSKVSTVTIQKTSMFGVGKEK